MSSLKKILIVLTLLIMPVLAIQVQAENKDALNTQQKAAVEDVVRELLLKKEPDLIVKAAQEMQRRLEKETTAKANEGIIKNSDKIFKDPTAYVGGNPKGDVTVVEFFDYQCGYCKMALPTVEKLLSEDKNVRFVYKELPILGPVSTFAAKAALASITQDKYVAFHKALMNKKERLSEDSILDVAKEVGLDVEKLKKDMESDKIEQSIKVNIDLAGEIGARGTPTFIIGDKLFPGAMPYDQIKQTVDEVRSAKKAQK